MARSLLAVDDDVSILRTIVSVAVREVDSCEAAGVELVEKDVVRPVASSSEMAAQVARIQNETGEGPCLSAIREHETFRMDDPERDGRWPKFAARALAETDVRSILGFRLFAEEDTMGALNLYSSRPNAFDDHALAVGSVLAAHAAVAMSMAREREYLTAAIENRDVIGQAKGILMEREGVDPNQAFATLRDRSQSQNIKLQEVVAQVLESARPR